MKIPKIGCCLINNKLIEYLKEACPDCHNHARYQKDSTAVGWDLNKRVFWEIKDINRSSKPKFELDYILSQLQESYYEIF